MLRDALDVAPTWTAAVLLVTGTQRRAGWIAVAIALVAAALLLCHLRR